jgi:uncharacterized membrane protein
VKPPQLLQSTPGDTADDSATTPATDTASREHPVWYRRAVDAVWRWLQRFEPIGLLIGVLFYSWSMSPSLLPRPWYLQAVATGISVAIGYGVGIAAVWICRKCGITRQWPPRWRKAGWYALGIVAMIVLPTMLVLGSWWQNITRELVGLQPGSDWDYPGVFMVGAVVFVLLVAFSRGLRRLTYLLYRLADRVLPSPLARGLSVLIVAVVVALIAEGVVSQTISRIANGSAQVADAGTANGVVAPTAPERSGSPQSLESWESLGREGRTFVAGGPSQTQIAEVTGDTALEPIRVYAGRSTVDETGLDIGRGLVEAIAAKVVAELERTGAFERRYLAVVTTTGRGWVNADVAAALEYLGGGNTAIAAMQYSFLASPLAFLADRETPRLAGRALFEAVYQRWSGLPADHRPKLLAFGESLGSYGGQDAFSGAQDMLARTDGALWVGTPNFTEQWQQITAGRDPASREILPIIYGGQNVRFASSPNDLNAPGLGNWASPRIVYWQHPSDPIVWWSPKLLLRRPDWLDEPRGADIDKGMTWIPLVSFWQVTLDMVFSADVPDGHGHSYGPEAVYFWNDILHLQNQSLADRIYTAMQNT